MGRANYIPEMVVTEPGSVVTDLRSYSTLAAAISDISTTPTTLLISRDETAAAGTTTIPSTITLRFTRGSVITAPTGATVVINGPIEAGMHQIFDITGTGRIVAGRTFGAGSANAAVVYPEWWGAVGDAESRVTPATGTDDTDALQNALYFFRPGSFHTYTDGTGPIVRGGTVMLSSGGRYLIDDTIHVPKNVRLIGHGGNGYRRIDVRESGSTIVLDDNSGTDYICLHEAATIEGVIIVNANIETWAAPPTVEPTWTGTAIMLQAEEGSAGSAVRGCFIVGFEYAIYRDSDLHGYANGFIFDNLWISCLNGIWLQGVNNPTLISNIYMYGFACPTTNGAGAFMSGSGIYIDDCDGLIISDVFIRGWRFGIQVRGLNGDTSFVTINNVVIEQQTDYATGPTKFGIVAGSPDGADPAETVQLMVTNTTINVTNQGGAGYAHYSNSDSFFNCTNCYGFGSSYGFYMDAQAEEMNLIGARTFNNTSAFYYSGQYDITEGGVNTHEWTNVLGDIRLSGNLTGGRETVAATSAGVAADPDVMLTLIGTNGDQDLDNVTLANGSWVGQIKMFTVNSMGHGNDSVKITPASQFRGGTVLTFAASPIGKGCTLVWDGSMWCVVSTQGGVLS